MDWLALVLALVKGLSSFTSWLNTRQLLGAGQAQAVADALRSQADELEKANAARETVRANSERHPDSVLTDDDGFKRSDP